MFLMSLSFIFVAILLYKGQRRFELLEANGISLSKTEMGQKNVKKFIWTFIIFLALISGVRHGFIDTYAYREMYIMAKRGMSYALSGAGWKIESGWLFTCYVLNFISSSPNFILLLSALLINYAYAHSCQKYSEDITLSLWMFFCLNWLDTNNGLRQFCAAALTILALPLLLTEDKDWRRRLLCYIEYAIIVYLGMQWHNSVKVCIPVMIAILGKPMNWKTWCVMLVCLAFVLGMDFAKDLFVEGSGETKYADMYLEKQSSGMGIPRAIVMGIVPLIAIVLYYWKCKRLNLTIPYDEGVLINLLIIQAAFTLLGLKIQVLARLCYYSYFSYFLIMPKLMKVICGYRYRNVRFIAICCLIFFFWFNVYMNYRYDAIQDFYFDVVLWQ